MWRRKNIQIGSDLSDYPNDEVRVQFIEEKFQLEAEKMDGRKEEHEK